MLVYVHCTTCNGERTYEVEVEGPDWDTGAGYYVTGSLVPEESCTCPYDEDKDWEEVSEKASEYPDDPH